MVESSSNMFPVHNKYVRSLENVVEGSLSATGDTSAEPLQVEAGRILNLHLSNTWVGSVTLMRKMPGEASYSPLTLSGDAYGVYTANINEPVWEEPEADTLFILSFVRTSGTLDYRIS